MILVTGANGHFGKTTIHFLLQKGVKAGEIAGLVRNNAKAEVLRSRSIEGRIGDYSNYDSLVKAFKGIDKLLLVSSTDLHNRSKQQENVVIAAKETGVKHIVYTSIERKNESPSSPLARVAESHLYTERILKESGIDFTILRNNIYLEYLPLFLGDKVLDIGVYFPAGEGKFAPATRTEMAEATAGILIGGRHQNKEYHFSNSEKITFKEIAEIISKASGKLVPYISPDTPGFIDTLMKAGVPNETVLVTAAFAEAIKQGELSPDKADLEYLLGRKPTNAKDFLTKYYSSK